MTARLTTAFAAQGRACDGLGSPFMGQLMALLAEHLTPDHSPLAARMFAWPGDLGASGHSLPLRLAGGLHALMRDGNPALCAVYPPKTATDDALWQAVSETIRSEARHLDAWLDSPPQTNELRRAVVLRAIGQWLTARHGLPLDLMELGASAGLNLNWDRFGLILNGDQHGPADAVFDLSPDWSGPLPPKVTPDVVRRRGVDLLPLDPVADRTRLLAYLWPDQPDRLDRMQAALTLPATQVDAGDAAEWLERVLGQPPMPRTCRLIYHTIAWQYFPDTTDTRARRAIEAAGAEATSDTPLAWFGMEPGGEGPGAALTLRLWPGDLTFQAGRVDFHGRWVRWSLS